MRVHSSSSIPSVSVVMVIYVIVCCCAEKANKYNNPDENKKKIIIIVFVHPTAFCMFLLPTPPPKYNSFSALQKVERYCLHGRKDIIYGCSHHISTDCVNVLILIL